MPKKQPAEIAGGVNRTMRQIVLVLIALFLVIPCRAQESSGRPEILGIAYVKLKVTDLDKAQAFYGGALGLASMDVSCRGFADACFLINPKQHIELVITPSGTQGSYLAEIGFATDDVAKMRSYLTARGVTAGKIMPGSNRSSYFKTQDFEGNHIAFVQPGKDPTEIVNPKALSNVLFHAGFVVKDSKAENRFYQDLLGFHLYWKGGFKDDGLDWYEIQVPDGNNWIEYMLNISPAADQKELGVQNHFSLGVVGADTAAERLRANGLREFDGPEVGRDGKKALDAYDPDHTRVEVMEFVPTGKPCCSSYTGPHPKP
jgi:catechol 2,3-dioxygenase-like lactoylglutathione lyase family enzyme